MNFDDVPSEFYVSCDPAQIDPLFVLRTLQETYWGGWLTLPTIQTAIRNSLCFGLYRRRPFDPAKPSTPPQQIGFARVVTDHATFAWLCDVVVSPTYRGRGLGTFLVQAVMSHPEVKPRPCLLCTKDAQGLYKKFGFAPMTAMKRAAS